MSVTTGQANWPRRLWERLTGVLTTDETRVKVSTGSEIVTVSGTELDDIAEAMNDMIEQQKITNELLKGILQ